jgi:hypothetical protein
MHRRPFRLFSTGLPCYAGLVDQAAWPAQYVMFRRLVFKDQTGSLAARMARSREEGYLSGAREAKLFRLAIAGAQRQQVLVAQYCDRRRPSRTGSPARSGTRN